jgi:DNA (cytosine-5)-methyltransferase 1
MRRIKAFLMPMRRPRAISLFSGCGGSDLALTRAGFDVIWSNDIWASACETNRINLRNANVVEGDIRGFNDFPEAELLVGCYPCQGYSQGGLRNPLEPVNFLYQEFDRVLRVVRPKAFVVENVNGMAYGENQILLMNQLCRYRLAGYRVAWRVLDAKHYGVPQTRKRIFLVGIRSAMGVVYRFPESVYGPGTRRRYRTQRDAIAGMPRWPEGEFCEERLHWYYLSRNRRRPWEQPCACIVGHWRHVPLHPSSPPLRRINTDKWRFKRPGRARRLSYKECAALQGFPKSFQWKHGSVRDRFQMIGNAVPPPLFEAVVGALPRMWD